MVDYYDETVDQFIATIVCAGIIGMLVSVIFCVTCPAEGLIGIGIATLVGGMSQAIKTGNSAYVVIGTGGIIWINVGQRKIVRRNAERLNAVATLAATTFSINIDSIVSVTSNEIDPVPDESNTLYSEDDSASNDNDEIENRSDQCNERLGIMFNTGDEQEIHQHFDNSNIDSQDTLESGLQLSHIHRQEHSEIDSVVAELEGSVSRVSSVIATVIGSGPVLKACSLMKIKNKTRDDWRKGEYETVSDTICGGKQHWRHSENDINSQDTLEHDLDLSYTNQQKDCDYNSLYSQEEVVNGVIPTVEDRDPDNSMKWGSILPEKSGRKSDDNERDITESSGSSKQAVEKVDRDLVDQQGECTGGIASKEEAPD